MRNDLFDLHIGMLFGGIWVEQGFEIIDEVMVFVGEFDGSDDNEIGDVLPGVLRVVIDSISSAGKVQSLMEGL